MTAPAVCGRCGASLPDGPPCRPCALRPKNSEARRAGAREALRAYMARRRARRLLEPGEEG